MRRMVKELVYRFYERRLAARVAAGPIPHHIGLIIDGNRRFARRAGYQSVAEGHRKGADKIDEVLAWCEDLLVPVVTVWALSTDNFARDPEELVPLLGIIEEKIADLAEAQKTARLPRRIRVVGRTELLSESTREVIARAEAETASYCPFQLTIAVGYGGREEITDAVRRMIADRLSRGDSIEGIAAGLEPDEIARYLYTEETPDPDLIIRTS